MIDPSFRNINCLFVLSFKNSADDPKRNFFNEYYMPLVEIKHFNVLIDNKPFFGKPAKHNAAGTQRPRDVPWTSPKGLNIRDVQGTNKKNVDLMKKVFFRCNSPCFHICYCFLLGKQIF